MALIWKVLEIWEYLRKNHSQTSQQLTQSRLCPLCVPCLPNVPCHLQRTLQLLEVVFIWPATGTHSPQCPRHQLYNPLHRCPWRRTENVRIVVVLVSKERKWYLFASNNKNLAIRLSNWGSGWCCFCFSCCFGSWIKFQSHGSFLCDEISVIW